jgi:hypothetical protein
LSLRAPGFVGAWNLLFAGPGKQQIPRPLRRARDDKS